MRLEVINRPDFPDGRARRLLPSLLRDVSPGIRRVAIVDVFLLPGAQGLSRQLATEVFSDAVSQQLIIDRFAAEDPSLIDWDFLVEVTVRPGVTDPVALTAREALRLCLEKAADTDGVQTAVQYLVDCGGPDDPRSAAIDLDDLARFFHNPLIQTATCITRAQWRDGTRPPQGYESSVAASPSQVRLIELEGLPRESLVSMSRERLLALSAEEMTAVQGYYAREDVREDRRARGLPVAATDVELEMIAQTWSEHCKHKIFNATIRYREVHEEVIHSLFKTYIRATTERVARGGRFLRSVFHDNSGVIAFDRRTLVCFKVETHNSPSALDPYGGAITGIVGVNRDIMGTGIGARPIFNTDVLCFGPQDIPASQLPAGLLHPRRVMEGVHRGIVDGGNQSGIPVVAGALLFHESYLGKPLVFCGTGGVLPSRVRGRDSCQKRVRAGDLAVMVGGRIGKDGIHGATFSSEALSESSPTSAVQIGDPITQKKMADMLLEARDLGYYRGLTDNGAGGLSSSLGEMARLSGGVRIDLDRCPLKYEGLAPWEILVSESQERMSLAVPPQRWEALQELAGRRGVEATVVGEFTATGQVEVMAHGRLVGLLEMDFLHEGLPVMDLPARWARAPEGSAAPHQAAGSRGPAGHAPALQPPVPTALVTDFRSVMLKLLAEPNVASKEGWVRQYDHEVQGRSVIKPFAGRRRDAPSDGAVLRMRRASVRGITVTHGICPWYGIEDTYDMAQCAVDEAVRAHVALGGDPRRMAALDNFCWPDPVAAPDASDAARADAQHKLAQLVRACRGLADACTAYRLPLISGKDSMKNDARVGGRVISVLPTLLVSLLGIIADVRRAVNTDLKGPGDLLYIVGQTRGELGGTRFQAIRGQPLGPSPSVRTAEAFPTYRKLHRAIQLGLVASCHDLSDGGLWVALAESCLGGDLGATILLDDMPVARGVGREPARLLFCETPSRFLVSVPVGRRRAWERAMAGCPFGLLGAATRDPTVKVDSSARTLASLTLQEIRAAWSGVQPKGAAP